MANTVDLADGAQGVITFRSGQQFWCPIIEPANARGLFRVRYESGWYALFRRDGVQQLAGVILRADGSTEDVVNHARDIVGFEPGPRPDGMLGEVSP